MRTALGLLGVLAFLTPVTLSADTILVNGSFELGPDIPSADINILGGSTAITGWTILGSRIDYLGTPWDVSDGVRALDLDGNDGTGGIKQTFSTALGQSYLVSFDLSGNPQGGPVVKAMRVEVGSFIQDYMFDTSGQTRESLIWQTMTFSFLASSTTTTLSFVSLSPSGNSYGALVDNARVSAVPEPGSLALLGIGLAGVGIAGRARTRRNGFPIPLAVGHRSGRSKRGGRS